MRIGETIGYAVADDNNAQLDWDGEIYLEPEDAFRELAKAKAQKNEDPSYVADWVAVKLVIIEEDQ